MRGKMITIDYEVLSAMPSDYYRYKLLNPQQVAILLALCEQQKWPTRWENFTGTRGDLERLMGDIEYRLMGDETMALDCNEVEECLVDSTIIMDLGNEISQVGQDAGDSGATGYKSSSPTKTLQNSAKQAKFTADLVEPDGSCDDDDKDKLWAVIKKIVLSVHLKNYEFLTAVAATTDLEKAAAKMGDNVPLMLAMQGLDLLNLADDILLTFATNYASAVTESFLYTVITDLFCAATDCQFTFQDFVDYVSSNAGGSFDIAATTFLDVAANLFGQSSGSGIFYALSWLQCHVLGLGEKFATQASIDMLAALAKSAPKDGQWRSYANACYPHTGSWQLIVTFDESYVKVGSEVVYYIPLERWIQVSGNASLLTQVYKQGYRYSQTGGGNVTKRLNVLNSGAQFQDARIYWKKESGAATAQINVASNLYSPPNNTTTNTSFFLDTYKALRGVGSPVGSISYLQVAWSQQLSSQSLTSMIKYIDIRGTGELPVFG